MHITAVTITIVTDKTPKCGIIHQRRVSTYRGFNIKLAGGIHSDYFFISPLRG